MAVILCRALIQTKNLLNVTKHAWMVNITWPTTLTALQRSMIVDASEWASMANWPRHDLQTGVMAVECQGCDAHCIMFELDPENAHAHSTLVIAIGVTRSLDEMPYDFKTSCKLPGVTDSVRVHSTFHAQFLALDDVIGKWILKHVVSGDVLFTGHGLGAPVAAIFAVSYGVKFTDKISYSGYGSPRPGNEAFADLMLCSTRLAVFVKNHRDPVCSIIPASDLPMHYAHAGQVIQIGYDPTPDLPDPIFNADHNILNYIENLKCQAFVTAGQTPRYGTSMQVHTCDTAVSSTKRTEEIRVLRDQMLAALSHTKT